MRPRGNEWLAVIELNDFPHIDIETEDGRLEVGSIAFAAHRKHPSLTHFLFHKDGKQVGEMVIEPPKHKQN